MNTFQYAQLINATTRIFNSCTIIQLHLTLSPNLLNININNMTLGKYIIVELKKWLSRRRKQRNMIADPIFLTKCFGTHFFVINALFSIIVNSVNLQLPEKCSIHSIVFMSLCIEQSEAQISTDMRN